MHIIYINPDNERVLSWVSSAGFINFEIPADPGHTRDPDTSK